MLQWQLSSQTACFYWSLSLTQSHEPGLRQTQHSNMRQQRTFSLYCDSTLNRSGRHLHINLCTTSSLGSIRDTFSAPRVQTFVLELFGTARVYVPCHWSLVFESRCGTCRALEAMFSRSGWCRWVCTFAQFCMFRILTEHIFRSSNIRYCPLAEDQPWLSFFEHFRHGS